MVRAVSTPDANRPLRVLVTDFAWPSLDIEREILSGVGAELVVAQTGDEAELIEFASDVDAILTNWKRVPEAAVRAAPRCMVIARYGLGVDNIPVALATELGIVVANVPDFYVNEVADHTMALLLACARRLIPFTTETRSGVWSLERAPGLPRLRDQALGLVGFGRIAQALVPGARGFGLRVMAYSRRLAAAAAVPGEIAGAALDVLSREPPAAHEPLLRAPNLTVTPHAAFYSDASIHEVQTRAATNVATVLTGDVPEHVVNPAVLESDALRMRARAAPL